MVLVVKSPPWEEVEICTRMEEKPAPPQEEVCFALVVVSPRLGFLRRVRVQGAAQSELEMEREMEGEVIYNGKASEVATYRMRQLTDLLKKCN